MPVLFHLRKEYHKGSLSEDQISPDPFVQFGSWFNEAAESHLLYPTAMVLSTCNTNKRPSSRIVLLKEFSTQGFMFFTHYMSKKGKQIGRNPFGSLLFPWHEIERQVRIEGKIEKVDEVTSDLYFRSRPEGSMIAAWASPQSEKIPSRVYLENIEKKFRRQFSSGKIERPTEWGGYLLKPDLFEFWQGRENRLHDRIEYHLEAEHWEIRRLAP